MSAAATTPWIPPRPTPQILKVDPALLPEYMAWFVNRRAYTRQSDTPKLDNQRYYYYQPKERLTKKRLVLDDGTVRKHLKGLQTIGLYAINPETQRSKWVAIDADYQRAHRDLAALKLELKEDGVEAALEMSRRGAHLWILCAEPLPAKDCRIYIYNLALRLEQPAVSFDGARGFQILEHVRVKRKASNNWWTQCPSCAKQGHDRSGDNLAISVGDPRFYKCWAGCTKEMIREALGVPIRQR